jgi:hypothetical protein
VGVDSGSFCIGNGGDLGKAGSGEGEVSILVNCAVGEGCSGADCKGDCGGDFVGDCGGDCGGGKLEGGGIGDTTFSDGVEVGVCGEAVVSDGVTGGDGSEDGVKSWNEGGEDGCDEGEDDDCTARSSLEDEVASVRREGALSLCLGGVDR